MNVLVLGGAISGRAAARLACVDGATVTVYDRNPIDVPDCATATGEWDRAILSDKDLVVTSPGFPEHTGPIPDVIESGIPLLSEMEYAVAHMDVPFAAVTGTNGKTTVTAVAADMLQASGVDALAAGNIGTALSDLAESPPPMLVIEASSFQLRFIDEFHANAAAILNIAPDHLDWHRDMAEYVAAKQRIFENQTDRDILVFDSDDPGAAAAVRPAPSRLVPVSGAAGHEVIVAGHSYPHPNLDRAYTMDLIAAGEIAAHMGATPEGIGRVLSDFAPGEHRRKVVGAWDGVAWVNDSKATNPHAAVASAAAYPSVVLIAGGRNKGLDLAPIVAVPSVRRVIGIGEASLELEAATEPERFQAAGDLATAVALAHETAEPGDTVLLAPGCASFDQFESYGARGDAFHRLVRARMGESNGN